MAISAASATGSAFPSCSPERPFAVPVGVEEDDLLGVDLGAVDALPFLRLEGVLGEGAGDVEAVALAHVLGDGFGLLAPADDGVPVGLRVALSLIHI